MRRRRRRKRWRTREGGDRQERKAKEGEDFTRQRGIGNGKLNWKVGLNKENTERPEKLTLRRKIEPKATKIKRGKKIDGNAQG